MVTWGWYVAGLGTAAMLRLSARPVARAARPALRAAIKGGLQAGREIQRLTEEAKGQLDDLTAEARAELDRDGVEPASTAAQSEV